MASGIENGLENAILEALGSEILTLKERLLKKHTEEYNQELAKLMLVKCVQVSKYFSARTVGENIIVTFRGVNL